MKVDRFEFSKKFDKAFVKLTAGEQSRITRTLTKATVDLSDPLLHQHELKGAKTGTVSLNPDGDLRVPCRIWDEKDEDGQGQTVALLLTVGSYSQLYG